MVDSTQRSPTGSLGSLAPVDSIRCENNSTPGPAYQETRDQGRSAKPKRTVVHVACLACRRLRTKCDGNRPSCMPCARRHETCEYDVEANTTRSNALKRKNEDLLAENRVLRKLYSFLRQRPPLEAEEIYRRIRNTEDPIEVYRHVVTADMLMEQRGSAPSTS